MDTKVRYDFNQEKQVIFNEILDMMNDILYEERQDIATTDRYITSFSLEKRILHSLKLPLRNMIYLQKALFDFHCFLQETGVHNIKAMVNNKGNNNNNNHHQHHHPQNKGGENPSEILEKMENYRKEINDKKRSIEQCIELSLLSIKSLYNHHDYLLYSTRRRFHPSSTVSHHHHHHSGGSSSTAPTAPSSSVSSPSSTRYLTVKEWLENIKTYMALSKNTSFTSLATVNWTIDYESESLQLEEETNYEIFGKLLDFIILSSYHKYRMINIHISTSQEIDHHRQQQQQQARSEGNSNNTSSRFKSSSGSPSAVTLSPNQPFSDERTLVISSHTSRLHIDISCSSSTSHHITHLQDEFQFYHFCDDFIIEMMKLFGGNINKTLSKGGNLTEIKNLWIPCNIKKKRTKRRASSLMVPMGNEYDHQNDELEDVEDDNNTMLYDLPSDKTMNLSNNCSKSNSNEYPFMTTTTGFLTPKTVITVKQKQKQVQQGASSSASSSSSSAVASSSSVSKGYHRNNRYDDLDLGEYDDSDVDDDNNSRKASVKKPFGKSMTSTSLKDNSSIPSLERDQSLGDFSACSNKVHYKQTKILPHIAGSSGKSLSGGFQGPNNNSYGNLRKFSNEDLPTAVTSPINNLNGKSKNTQASSSSLSSASSSSLFSKYLPRTGSFGFPLFQQQKPSKSQSSQHQQQHQQQQPKPLVTSPSTSTVVNVKPHHAHLQQNQHSTNNKSSQLLSFLSRVFSFTSVKNGSSSRSVSGRSGTRSTTSKGKKKVNVVKKKVVPVQRRNY
jgi:hypothetical protein